LPLQAGTHYALSVHDSEAVTGGAVVTREASSTNAGMSRFPGTTGLHTPYSL
jgi:hypothetical protein